MNLCFSINSQLKEKKSETKAISKVAMVFVKEDKYCSTRKQKVIINERKH